MILILLPLKEYKLNSTTTTTKNLLLGTNVWRNSIRSNNPGPSSNIKQHNCRKRKSNKSLVESFMGKQNVFLQIQSPFSDILANKKINFVFIKKERWKSKIVESVSKICWCQNNDASNLIRVVVWLYELTIPSRIHHPCLWFPLEPFVESTLQNHP